MEQQRAPPVFCEFELNPGVGAGNVDAEDLSGPALVVNVEAALIEEIKPLLGQEIASCDCSHTCCFLDLAVDASRVRKFYGWRLVRQAKRRAKKVSALGVAPECSQTP